MLMPEKPSGCHGSQSPRIAIGSVRTKVANASEDCGGAEAKKASTPMNGDPSLPRPPAISGRSPASFLRPPAQGSGSPCASPDRSRRRTRPCSPASKHGRRSPPSWSARITWSARGLAEVRPKKETPGLNRALGRRPVGWGSQGGPSRLEASAAALRDDVAEYFGHET